MLDLAVDSRIMLDNVLDCALQELDMLFNTTNTEVLGNMDYGCNFEQFLWSLTPNDEQLKNYIRERIRLNTYYFKQFDYDIDVQSEMGEYRDIYYVTITMKVDETVDDTIRQKTTKVYMLQ